MRFDIGRIAGLILLTLLALAGCEEAPDDDVDTDPKFNLLTPKDGVWVLEKDDQELKLTYSGDVNSDTISIVLNGVAINDKMEVNDFKGRAWAPLSALSNALIQGRNILEVSTDVPPPAGSSEPPEHFSETFVFFVDDQPPHLEITRVTPSEVGADGRPAPGASLTVEGNIVDVADITGITFNYAGGSVRLQLSPTAALADNRYTNVIAADGYRKFRAVLPSYPDLASPSNRLHFSYAVYDVNGHSFTDSFMASGAKLSTKLAFQMNNGFLDNMNPIVNGAIERALGLASLIPGSGGDLEGAVAQAARSSLPQTLVNPSINSAPYPATRILASAQMNSPGAQWCSALLIRPATGADYCVVYLKDIVYKGLRADTLFWDNKGELNLNLSLHADEISVSVEIAAVDFSFGQYFYQGGIHGTVGLYNFPITTNLRIYPDSQYLFRAERTSPVSINVTQMFGGPGFTGYCDPGVCTDPATLAWASFFYNIGWDVFDSSGSLNPDGKPDIQQIVPVIEGYINPFVLPIVDGLFDPASQDSILQPAVKTLANTTQGEIVNETFASSIKTVIFKNAMTISQGNFTADPGFYTDEYLPVGGGLGSHYQPQGCFIMPLPIIGPSGCGTAFPEQINNKAPLDLVFAIPSNSINQYLLAGHQTGRFDDFSLDLPGSFLSNVRSAQIDESDTVNLAFDFNQAPYVHFVSSSENSGATACIWILGQRVCSNDGGAPGSIKVMANNLGISVENTNNPGVSVLDVNVDMEFEIFITHSNGSPVVSLKDDSVKVEVNRLPADLNNSRGLVADRIARTFEAYLLGDDFQRGFRNQDMPISVDDYLGNVSLPGGIVLSYSSLLSDVLPRYYGVIVRDLSIVENGSYLYVAIDIRNSSSPWTATQIGQQYLNIIVDE